MIKHENKPLKIKQVTVSSSHRSKKNEVSKPRSADHIDVATLAQFYNSPPSSNILREELLEEARRALVDYELAEADLEIAAQTLAKTMHMLVEQHGGKTLEPELKAELVRHVLDWCGIQCPSIETSSKGAKQPIAREELIRRPESPDQPLPKHHHANKRLH